jgi:predicted phage terminase large subunit-like protein
MEGAPSLAELERAIALKSLADWVPYLTRRYVAPTHLAPFLELIEAAAEGAEVRAVVHAPPRHSKTESILHAIPWILKQHPDWTCGYSSYNADITRSKSRAAIALAREAGINLVTDNLSEWRTFKGGGCVAKGVGEGLTGYGLNVAFVDDSVKDRLEAESARKREAKWDWFENVLMTRIEPKGSVFVCQTRWHPDDISGRLIKKGWKYICLPALTALPDGGWRALWPERWPTDALLRRREDVGEYVWASLYQGQPRPRGGAVFGDPWGYAALPDATLPRRHGIGLDFAFTKKTSSDYSALVVMMFCEGYFYVLDVVRVQTRAPEFKETIRAYHARYPTAKMRWIASGTEKGVADFVSDPMDPGAAFVGESGLPIEVVTARGDKFVRSIAYAAAWNAGRVLVPEDSTSHRWVDDFLVEHAEFTGVDDPKDDQVDASVAAHGASSEPVMTFEGTPEGLGSLRI